MNDPLVGQKQISVEEFNKAWQANGARGVVVAPQPIPTIPESAAPLFGGIGAALALASLAALGTARKGLGAGRTDEGESSWANYTWYEPAKESTWADPPTIPEPEPPDNWRISTDDSQPTPAEEAQPEPSLPAPEVNDVTPTRTSSRYEREEALQEQQQLRTIEQAEQKAKADAEQALKRFMARHDAAFEGEGKPVTNPLAIGVPQPKGISADVPKIQSSGVSASIVTSSNQVFQSPKYYGPYYGQDPDSKLAYAFEKMTLLDDNGKPLSPVSNDIVRLIRARNDVKVEFLPYLYAMNPELGKIILSSSLQSPSEQAKPESSGVISHEFTHLLSRDVKDSNYWPQGWPTTTDMELAAYIVEEAVVYDQLSIRINKPTQDSSLQNDRNSQNKISEKLYTYTSSNRSEAIDLMLQDRPHPLYLYKVVNMLENLFGYSHEPWEVVLRRTGFSEDSILHIKEIAQKGAPK